MSTATVRTIKNDIPALRQMGPIQADRALSAAAEEGTTYVKLSIESSPPTGASYRRGQKTHIASAPGQPPRPDTGTLLASIHWEPVSQKMKRIVAATDYVFFLEYGATYMAPRPFMGPMARWLEDNIEEFFRDYLSARGL